MATDYSWIYLLIFIVIPLTRIIPRLIAKRRMQNSGSQTIQESFRPSGSSSSSSSSHESPNTGREEPPKPQTASMLVLGELSRGARTFESIQKNTQFGAKELDKILGDLEKNGMIMVRQSQGLLGPKVELYPTEKGYREFSGS